MARTYSVEFNIGAALGSSFKRSLGSAQDHMQKLGATMRGMEKQKFHAGEVAKYSQELKDLRRRQEKAGYANRDLNAKIAETQHKFREAARAAQKYGVEIGGAARQYKRLDTAMAQAERRMGRMQKMQQNRDTRQQIHGQFMGVAAAGATVAFPIKQAMEFESKMADVKKVMDFETPQQFKALSRGVLNLSTRLPMAASGIGDIMASAGQAGIARDELTAFAETAVKMGTAFDMTGRVAGKTMAGWRAAMRLSQDETIELADAVNHLSNSMNAEAGELTRVINRQGASAQTAGLMKQEVAALGATLLTSNQGAERSATAMKKLLSTLTAGEQAPNRIKNSLQALGFSAKGMAERMQVDAQGAIRSVFQALKELPEAARPGMLKEVFGEEGKDVISPLLTNLENLDQAFAMVSDKTKYAGSMQKEYAERAKTTENQMQIFQNRVSKLGITLGFALLPPLNAVMGVAGKTAGVVADLADEHPFLTKVVFGAAAALVSFKVASLAGRYGMSLVSDAVQFGKATFDFFRPSVLALNASLIKQKAVAVGLAAWQWIVAGATKAWTAAQWLLNVALWASPIGLVIAGVALLGTAAYFLVKKWETVKVFFTDLWDWLSSINLFEIGKNIIGSLVSGLKALAMKPVEAVKGVFKKVRELLPFSDAKTGPLSDLIASGKSIPHTIGAGIRRSGPRPVSGAMDQALSGANTPSGMVSARSGPTSGRQRPSVEINYNPTIYVNGDGDVRQQAEQGIRAGSDYLADRMRAVFRRERRLSFA